MLSLSKKEKEKERKGKKRRGEKREEKRKERRIISTVLKSQFPINGREKRERREKQLVTMLQKK